jgi:hypothetical protein
MLTLPPVPFVADPVLRVIMPLLPSDVVPEVKERDPDAPLVPPLAVRMLKTPLDFALP